MAIDGKTMARLPTRSTFAASRPTASHVTNRVPSGRADRRVPIRKRGSRGNVAGGSRSTFASSKGANTCRWSRGVSHSRDDRTSPNAHAARLRCLATLLSPLPNRIVNEPIVLVWSRERFPPNRPVVQATFGRKFLEKKSVDQDTNSKINITPLPTCVLKAYTGQRNDVGGGNEKGPESINASRPADRSSALAWLSLVGMLARPTFGRCPAQLRFTKQRQCTRREKAKLQTSSAEGTSTPRNYDRQNWKPPLDANGSQGRATDWRWSSARWYSSDRTEVDNALPILTGIPPEFWH